MDKASYNPLLSNHSEDDESTDTYIAPSPLRRWWDRWGRYIIVVNIVVPWLVAAGCASIVIHYSTHGTDGFRQHKLYPSQLTYFPAQEAIEYKTGVFHQNIETAPSQFQGPPSEQLDKAWEDLYQFGLSTIPREQAERMPNYTSPIPNHEGL